MSTVPDEVRSALAGPPVIGAWEPMFPLVTVDGGGFPHICLLSRAELAADPDRIRAVFASPTTIANLTRIARATLIVVGERAATYLKLVAVRTEPDGAWLGVIFDVAATSRDALDTPLRPPGYLAREHIAVDEDWARGSRLLAHLAQPGGDETRWTTG